MIRKRRREAVSPAAPPARQPTFEGARSAVVVATDPGDAARVTVRLVGEARSPKVEARLAVAGPYTPAPGDRVVVAGSPDGAFLIGVLHASGPRTARLADGATVHIAEDRVDIQDPTGHVVARYERGAVHLAAARGDLVLGAPGGKVAIRAGQDIELSAARDVTHAARRTLTLRAEGEDGPTIALGASTTRVRAPHVDLTARRADVKLGDTTILAQRIQTTAALLRQDVERLEVTAHQILETARDTFREAKDLAETRIGRARTLVRGLFSLTTKRTDLTSEEDTSIDGRRVLLG